MAFLVRLDGADSLLKTSVLEASTIQLKDYSTFMIKNG
jgi:hypothetical protein